MLSPYSLLPTPYSSATPLTQVSDNWSLLSTIDNESLMHLPELLHNQGPSILNSAMEAMQKLHARHYDQAGTERLHQRLKALFTLIVRGIKDRNLTPMVNHAEAIAVERYTAGYDLWEVQAAFNALEESIWTHILREVPSNEYAEALGLISTILGAGKDALARRYVALAMKGNTATFNLQSLFSGTEFSGEAFPGESKQHNV